MDDPQDYQPYQVELAVIMVMNALMPDESVIFAEQNSSISPPYMTVQVNHTNTVGKVDSGKIDDNGVMEMLTLIQGAVTVKSFGNTARDVMNNFRARLQKVSSRDIMKKHNVVLHGPLEIFPMSVIRQDAYFEPCMVMDLKLRCAMKFSDDVGLIEHVIGDGTLNEKSVTFDVEIKHTGA